MPKLYRCVAPFVFYQDGTHVHFNPGSSDVYTEDHPAVRRNPAAFEVVSPLGKSGPEVETATAAPGEKRDVKVPRGRKG